MYAVYILLCADDSYYTGMSNDFDKRIWQHETGYFPECYTFKRRPLKLMWHTRVKTAEEANELEKQIKGWSRKKKEALISGDIDELKKLSNNKKEDSEKTLRQAQGQVDYLIIGQGISGTWLSYYLQKEGRSFIVIDNNYSNAPSRVAAGIINPVTGRRHATVWMADELLPFAWNAYNELEQELGIKSISQKNIIDFFPSAQMRHSFAERVKENTKYVSLPQDEKRFLDHFNYELGFGEISPVYTAHLENILPAWRKVLLEKNSLLEEEFVLSELQIKKEGIHYKNIKAGKIIFCDGPGCANNSWFEKLPFAPNKGEALTLFINDLPAGNIYKRGLTLAPLANPGHWWIGSSYEWDFANADPTDAFREKTETLLKQWLKLPFEVTGHFASLRPATLERRPFVGLHPQQPSIGILNGMGTKGCSLAPFFAKQLVDHLLFNKNIYPDAGVDRFRKILSRNLS